ncbi:hypothetical protein ACFQO4_02190 [Saliphagus sp. GCM10025334]
MKPDRDALRCVVPHCGREAAAATPDGPMCSEHAAELAEGLR